MENVARFERAARILVRYLFHQVLRKLDPNLDHALAKDTSGVEVLSESLGFDAIGIAKAFASKHTLGDPPSAEEIAAFLVGIISTIEMQFRPKINALHGNRATAAFMAAALLEVAAILAQFTALDASFAVLQAVVELAIDKAEIFLDELGIRITSDAKTAPQRIEEYERQLSIAIGDTHGTHFDYDVFFSYATEDKEVVAEIYDALATRQIKCFMAHKNISAGDLWEEHIRKALLASRLAVVLLTKDSISSQWVLCEAGACWALSKPLIPALMGIDNGQLPAFVSKHQTIRVDTIAGRNDLMALILQRRRSHSPELGSGGKRSPTSG